MQAIGEAIQRILLGVLFLVVASGLIRALDGATVVPHPFQRTRYGVRRTVLDETRVDAVEVSNSLLSRAGGIGAYAGTRARSGTGNVAGSDAHSVPNVARAYTEVAVDASSTVEVSVEQVVAALSTGDTSVVGRRTPTPKSTVQYGKSALRNSLYEFTSRAPLVPAVPSPITEYGTDR